jgi:ammonium transporter, Amt family
VSHSSRRLKLQSLGLLALSLLPSLGFAADAPKLDTGDTAWMLVSTALVFLMTPGLAFFYGGMVRTKNVTTTLFQSFSAVAVVSLIWVIAGYSLSFSEGSGFLGSLDHMMLNGVDQEPNADFSATIPHVLFMLYQCMFAVITPALFTGAFAERTKFKGWIALCALWSLAVYVPVAHWVWGLGGWIRMKGALDFAGGMVVHMTAGFSALALTMVLGKRKDFGSQNRPYDVGYVALGTALLYFGWFGFNGGSALGSNGLAAQAFTNTFMGGAAALATWALYDTFVKGKPNLVGACIGAVVGLVAVTPAAGYVTVPMAILIGAIGALAANIASGIVKEKLHLDDTLDVFACHGIGGTIGTILTAVFANKAVNPAGADGLLAGNTDLFVTHLIAAAAVASFSFGVTFVLAKIVQATLGLRATNAEEQLGLDNTEHGEIINSNFENDSTGTIQINPNPRYKGDVTAA